MGQPSEWARSGVGMIDSTEAVTSEGQGLKTQVLDYYEANSHVYSERYSVNASGDVVWVRHRAILQMVQNMGLPPQAKVLDVGCGPGFLSFDLAKLGFNGVGVDGTPAMVARSKAKAEELGTSSAWEYRVGDVEQLPVDSGSFDLAICSGVIEYLPGDDKLLSEVSRALKPNGRFLLCVTNKYGYTVSLLSVVERAKKLPGVVKVASALRKAVVGGEHGVMTFNFLPRKHTPRNARRLMEKYGFTITEDRYVQFSMFPAPLCYLTSKLTRVIDERLGFADRTPLRRLGSCYLMSGKR